MTVLLFKPIENFVLTGRNLEKDADRIRHTEMCVKGKNAQDFVV